MKRCLVMFCLCSLVLTWAGIVLGEEVSPKDREKTVTVFPIVLNSGAPIVGVPADMSKNMAELVGLFLERAGMKEIEIDDAVFLPPENADLSKVAEAFGKFLQSQKLGTEYALYGQFIGTPGKGVDEIRFVVVDRQGKVVLSQLRDRQQLSSLGEKIVDPMIASYHLVCRLQGLWGLADPNRKDAPEGKMAKLWNEKAGIPSKSEREALKKRLDDLKEKITTSKVTVYPIHLWEGSDKSGAIQLAKILNEAGICLAEPSDVDIKIKIKGNSNEQKVLWDTARAFRDFLRNNPPATEYALLASYGISSPSDGKHEAGAVHLILCDQKGDWVLVDYQNSHHPDFQSIAPKSLEDCNRLAVVRLKSYLSKQSPSEDK
jgi:hypothetical protein